MRVSRSRWVIGLLSVCAYAWLAFAQPLLVHAADPVCYDPKTKLKIPCPPTDVPANGGNNQPGTETNGRLCLAAFNDLNFNSIQDAGEPLLSGGQVQVTNLATSAVSLVDLLADGPNCQFLPGGADYLASETLPSGFSSVGSSTVNAHLDVGGTVQILFANTNSAPTPSATATVKATLKPPTASATATATASSTATATSTTTSTATATATASPSPTPSDTPVAPAVSISGNLPPAVQPTQPPPPAPSNDAQPLGACSPWLIGAGLGLLTAGVSLAGLGLQARRRATPNPAPTDMDSDSPHDGGTGDGQNGFDWSPTQAQQRTVNTAFTSKTPSRPNDRLRSAGPASSGVDGSAYQLSLAGLPNPTRQWPRWLGLGLLGVLAVGGAILAVTGAAGAAGSVACSSWPTGAALGVGGLILAGAILSVLQTPQVSYTLFLPDGTPTRATVQLKMKQSTPLMNKQEAGPDGNKSTGGTSMTSKHSDKSDAASNSTSDSDKAGNQTKQSSDGK